VGYDAELDGIPFKRMGHGRIKAFHQEKEFLFTTWEDFKDWVKPPDRRT
jgi:hypothetical protein